MDSAVTCLGFSCGFIGFVCEEKANKPLYRLWRGMLCVLLRPALTTSVFQQSLRSQSRSNCLQPLPHRSLRGKLRRILTSLHHCATARHSHTAHTSMRGFRVYPCQVKHCEAPGEALRGHQQNMSSSINGCFSWLAEENIFRNDRVKQSLGSQMSCLTCLPAYRDTVDMPSICSKWCNN